MSVLANLTNTDLSILCFKYYVFCTWIGKVEMPWQSSTSWFRQTRKTQHVKIVRWESKKHIDHWSLIKDHIKESQRRANQTSPPVKHWPSHTAKKATPAMELDTGTIRMKTRAQNAATHPGKVMQEKPRRSKEEIQKEKELKAAKKAAKAKTMAEAEALKAAGRAFVAQREQEDAAAAANAEKEFPRQWGGTRGECGLSSWLLSLKSW
jgi:hypothetical protein